jgi:hypothetical protein
MILDVKSWIGGAFGPLVFGALADGTRWAPPGCSTASWRSWRRPRSSRPPLLLWERPALVQALRHDEE